MTSQRSAMQLLAVAVVCFSLGRMIPTLSFPPGGHEQRTRGAAAGAAGDLVLLAPSSGRSRPGCHHPPGQDDRPGCHGSAAGIPPAPAVTDDSAVRALAEKLKARGVVAGRAASSPGAKMAVFCLMGTRPEAVKLAPVIAALNARAAKDIVTVVVFSGQHPDLILPFVQDFGITVDVSLDVMRSGQSLSQLTSRLIAAIGGLLSAPGIHCHMMICQGDTTSAAMGAMAAFYHQIPVAHVEAGLRTYNTYSPMPEEFNRQLVGIVGALHFAPTRLSGARLAAEGIPRANIIVTGNTVIDAVKSMNALRRKSPARLARGADFLRKHAPLVLSALSKPMGAFTIVRVVLLTCHRRENQGAPADRIFAAVNEMVAASAAGKVVDTATKKKVELHFVYPVHPNAISRQARAAFGATANVHLTPPMAFDELSYVMDRVFFAMTDSGGIQEESTVYRLPVIVLRESTERSEGVLAGVAELLGSDKAAIVSTGLSLLQGKGGKYDRMSRPSAPYGSGNASEQIVATLLARKDSIMRGTMYAGREEQPANQAQPGNAGPGS